jgi:hypothetical protein
MKQAILLTLAALTVCSAGAAAAADAPFGCDAAPGQTCFFNVFLGPRATRAVQLPAGVKQKIPGVTIGQDSYCVALNAAPPYTCSHKIINADYNN